LKYYDTKKILQEIQLCKKSPYYFATKYLTVKNHKGEIVKFTTPLNETSFNEMFENWDKNNKN